MTPDNTPTIDQFRPVVLRVLADGKERSTKEICELCAEYSRLTPEVRAEKISSGQARYINRVCWACSALAISGLVERPQRGVYRITQQGREVDRRSLQSYTEKDMLEWPAWRAYQQEIAQRSRAGASSANKAGEENAMTAIAAQEKQDPIEALTAGERDFNAQTETQLRKRLQESSPEFFERAVIDVLWAMGYGGAHGEKKHVGRSGDGGIDGIIRQDALGLTNIYIQAKRYSDSNKVSEPEIRNFIGSLDARGANQGVFITTSTFQPSAKRTAERYRHGKIVLIDGITLTSLMLSYGVAVHKAHQFTLYEIDDDFFEEELG